MTNRDRAWRRRKARTVLTKVKQTKEWISHQFQGLTRNPPKAIKHHRPGALSQAQFLRQAWSMNQDLREGNWSVDAA